MTFAIVGRGSDGELGVAVSSCVLAVGARCPAVAPGRAAISSQAYVNAHLAGDVLERLDAGLAEAVAGALAADPARDWRQLVAVAADGTTVAHTGAANDPWAGHRIGEDCAAAGNLLTGPDVVDAMVAAFATGAPLAERLLGALEAGQSAGGDRRGRQSAALLVHGPEPPAYVDLRVDDHREPVAELRRLWELMTPDARERAWQVASTRELESVEELRSRQEQLRSRLE
jgi:uncharacterized Ntn-hydrolase superfamily protein